MHWIGAIDRLYTISMDMLWIFHRFPIHIPSYRPYSMNIIWAIIYFPECHSGHLSKPIWYYVPGLVENWNGFQWVPLCLCFFHEIIWTMDLWWLLYSIYSMTLFVCLLFIINGFIPHIFFLGNKDPFTSHDKRAPSRTCWECWSCRRSHKWRGRTSETWPRG